MRLAARIERMWWRPGASIATTLLAPAAGLFGALTALRRWLYRRGWLASARVAVPVVVVGNITVGGAGKTPLTLALAEALVARGLNPGIVSRGYGRRSRAPGAVTATSDWREVGDEPLILARSGLPVWVGAARVDACRALIAAHPRVDVILCDDGLQHYALARDFEIAVVDRTRAFGNGRLLPAGPLREPVARLATVDAIVERAAGDDDRDLGSNAVPTAEHRYAMRYRALAWRRVAAEAVRGASEAAGLDPSALAGRRIAAIAGIAHPDSFFTLVAKLGIVAQAVAFPDHHAYRREELTCPGAAAILMTEKDAVKCREFGDARMWFLPIVATVDSALIDAIVEALRGPEASRDARLPGDQGPADP